MNHAIATELVASMGSSHLKPIQPWHWRSLPLGDRTGSQIFQALFLNSTTNHSIEKTDPVPTLIRGVRGDRDRRKISQIATLLESPVTKTKTSLARYSICAGSPRIIEGQAQLWTPPIGEILPFLRRLLQLPQIESTVPPELPFTGGWLGWLAYDVAWEIEQLPQHNTDPLPFPTAYWYQPESFAVLDRHQEIIWLATTNPAELDSLQHRLEKADKHKETIPKLENSNPVTPTFQISEQEYIAAVKQAKVSKKTSL